MTATTSAPGITGCVFRLLHLWGPPFTLTHAFFQDALVKQVASVNKNTIVVVNSVGPIVVEQWINHPNGM